MRPLIAAQTLTQTDVSQTKLARLVLTNYRCYSSLRLSLDSSCVVFVGPNGAGKTNILEAISLLVPGRGFRKAKLSEMTNIQSVSRQWGVAAGIDTAYGRLDIGTALELSLEGNEKRAVKIDGERALTQSQLYEVISVIWLTPQMEKIFNEGPSSRRKFLDKIICSVSASHSKHLYRYEHAMRERSKLLRSGRADANWLDTLEETMATQATAITSMRHLMVEKLSTLSEQSVGVFPKARVNLLGSLNCASHSALEAEDNLRELLKKSRKKDAESGGASYGPHLSDVQVWHIDKNMPANFCSTGEQKALLITLILANVRLHILERGAMPILLLDEVAAHLDEVRRKALFDEIDEIGVQSFLTGTHRESFEALDKKAQFFWVENAKVQEQDFSVQ